MRLLIAVLLLSIGACASQGRFERAGESADDAISNVREGAQDVADDVRDAAKNVRDDVKRSRKRAGR